MFILIKMVNKLKSKKADPFWRFLFKAIWFIIKIPYQIVRFFFVSLIHFIKKQNENVSRKRQSLKSKYEEFKILKGDKNKYSNWFKKLVNSDSLIGIIIGARGSGKSAIGIKLLENLHAKSKRKCFAMGFRKEEMPDWINVVEKVDSIENNSFVLIDEGGVLFNSRNAMSSANKILSELLLISRHKNLSIIFISQNSSNLEINILRQADFLILKPSSLLQSNFERKIIQKMYEETEKDFKKYENNKGLAYIYSDQFKGFVSNPLPSFWNVRISKSFSNK